MIELPVAPLSLTQWLSGHGWQLERTKPDRGTIWRRAGSEVFVPLFADDDDARLRLQVAITAIAETSGVSADALAREVAFVRSDVMEWRVVDAAVADNGLSLSAADQLVSSVRRVVIFCAAAVDHRRGYFGRRVRQRARDEANRVRIAQSRTGSYVLPIVSDISGAQPDSAMSPLNVDVEVAPYSRRVLLTVEDALSSAAAIMDFLPSGPTVQQANELVARGVSYEFSTAVADLLESPGVATVEVSFHWAPLGSTARQSRSIEFDRGNATFFRRLAGNLFETSEIGEQRFVFRVKSSGRFDEADREGGVAVFRRAAAEAGRTLIRAELSEEDYQTVLVADSNRELVSVIAKLIEEEGHRPRLEEIVEVRRIVQGSFDSIGF